MPKGFVKWFNDDKKFGYIVPEDGSGDVFISLKDHNPGLQTLRSGQSVEYTLANLSGIVLCATNVVILNDHDE